ncbi:MAG: Ig-like domain-containing protein [Clostridia bacterium]|nr:Ig-like domain-containing protein [Clostridia bacterium]
MKKKILALICILSMLAAMAPAMGAMAASEKAVMFEKDFLVNGSALTDKDGNGTDITSKTFDSKMEFNEQGGYAYATQIDSAHGNSLKLGLETSAGTADPFFAVPLSSFHKSDGSGSVVLEFDYYIDSKTDVKKDYGSSTGYSSYSFYIASHGIYKTLAYWDQAIMDNFNLTGSTVAYDAQVWNKCRLEYSWTKSGTQYTYSYKLQNGKYGENGFEGYDATSFVHSYKSDKKVTYLRFYAPRNIKSEKWIALDNVAIKQEKDDPRITGIEGGSVAYDAKTVSINLSDKIYNRDKNYVALYEGETECELSTVSFDSSNNRITVKPAEGFKPMTTYKVVLKTSTEVDIAGTTLSKAEEITFTTTVAPVKNTPIEENFENATISGSDITLDSGISVSKGSGYALVREIDAEHTNSLKIGIGESGTQMPHIDIPLTTLQSEGQNGNASLEFECLIGTKPAYEGDSIPSAWYSEGAFRLGSDDSADKKFLYWHSDMRNNYSNSTEFEYETNKWYKVVLDLTWVPSGSQFNYTCKAQIKDLDWSYTYTINNALFTSISFFAPKTVNEEVWAALDNIKLSTQKPIPDICGFEAFDDLDAFNAADTSAPAFVNVDKKNLVAVYLTETIAGVDETLVSLKENGIDVEIEKVGYDGSKNAVLLLLTEALKDNTAYTFTLSGNTEVWSEVPMGVERTKAFTTSADTVSIDVDSDDITIADGVATVNVTATNVSDDEVKVYVIANVWDGNKFIGQTVTVQNVFATAPSQMISASVSGVENGYTVYVYAWNNVFGAEMLTNKIVSKTNN